MWNTCQFAILGTFPSLYAPHRPRRSAANKQRFRAFSRGKEKFSPGWNPAAALIVLGRIISVSEWGHAGRRMGGLPPRVAVRWRGVSCDPPPISIEILSMDGVPAWSLRRQRRRACSPQNGEITSHQGGSNGRYRTRQDGRFQANPATLRAARPPPRPVRSPSDRKSVV